MACCVDSHAAGDDRCDRHRRSSCVRSRRLDGKPHARELDGRCGRGGRRSILNAAGIPTFEYPDTAARAFALMWRYSDNLRALYETPALPMRSRDDAAHRRTRPRRTTHRRPCARPAAPSSPKSNPSSCSPPTASRPSRRTSPRPKTRPCSARSKSAIPVVLKLHSETITHKTDVGGVQLNLRDADGGAPGLATRSQTSVTEKAGRKHFLGVTVQPMVTRDGYELILGSSVDPQFGPVLLFGAGGQLVEVFKDRALGLPPLNATLARRMMEQTTIYTALKGVRGRKPVDLAALEQLLVRFSQLVVEQPWIAEIDINPLLVSPERIIALDARIVLHPPGHALKTSCPSPPSVLIRRNTSRPWKLKDGTAVTIRPIRPEDEPLMVRFHQTLSERSVYLRYFATLKLDQRIAHERLSRICFNDYDREMALVVERRDPTTRPPKSSASAA